MNAHVHIEHPEDTTEHEVGVVVGYTDPHEVTGSELETEPLAEDPHIPVGARWHRWRLYRDGDYWCARQPSQIEQPMFRSSAPVAGRTHGHADRSWYRAMHELQLAVLIAKSHE